MTQKDSILLEKEITGIKIIAFELLCQSKNVIGANLKMQAVGGFTPFTLCHWSCNWSITAYFFWQVVSASVCFIKFLHALSVHCYLQVYYFYPHITDDTLLLLWETTKLDEACSPGYSYSKCANLFDKPRTGIGHKSLSWFITPILRLCEGEWAVFVWPCWSSGLGS